MRGDVPATDAVEKTLLGVTNEIFRDHAWQCETLRGAGFLTQKERRIRIKAVSPGPTDAPMLRASAPADQMEAVIQLSHH
jgi:hypothetical protein